MLKRTLTLGYGVLVYLLFFAVFNYTIMFIGNIWVSPSLDSSGSSELGLALLIDIGLLTAFALQHSIMARPAFKRAWTRVIPESMERSTYVLASTLVLACVVVFWQPLGGVLWQVTDPLAVGALYGLFAVGWGILFLASFQINHFDLFGLRQVWLHFRGRPYTPLTFKTPWLYRHMRHPLYVGLMIGLWAAPTMTIAHLVFALLCTAYIFVGTRLEEKDLEKALPEYLRYKQEVPMFVPNMRRKASKSIAGVVSSAR